MSLVRARAAWTSGCSRRAVLEPDPEGTTVLTGPNGTGKTTVLEAVAYLGTQRSFRGAPTRGHGPRRVPTGAWSGPSSRRRRPPRPGRGRAAPAPGRSRAQVNRQPVRAAARPGRGGAGDGLHPRGPGPRPRAARPGAGTCSTTRCGLLDPAAGAPVDEVERVLRQRAALLRQAGGPARSRGRATLDVWDERLAAAGDALVGGAGTALARGPLDRRSPAGLRGPLPDRVGPAAVRARGRRWPTGARWEGPLRRGARRGPRPTTCGGA